MPEDTIEFECGCRVLFWLTEEGFGSTRPDLREEYEPCDLHQHRVNQLYRALVEDAAHA